MTRDTCPAASARPLRRDAERNRRRILDSARQVFGERGLEATLDDIAHHAGLGVGTVYRRFPSKEHLVEAMFAERLDEIGKLAEQALKQVDPWAGLVQFMWQTAEMHTADRGLRQIMLSKEFGHGQVEQARLRLATPITEVFERAQRAGKLRPDVRATDLPMVQQMVGGVAEYTHEVQPELWRRYLSLLLDGLRAQPGAPTDLTQEPLDEDALEEVMCSWRWNRR
ncbi:TetR/AcrR family transcriptional regulator [Amycolatopsis nigrescens]|uniref:TetR/AcrR family transcriptional regulator n=1 Tax=Amycolatopsis nigrescens TaxID=381445 RepID=UPI00037935E2|nr:TetR/AcrR family transcriptional regulator [Amycolatopsis nigrescens]